MVFEKSHFKTCYVSCACNSTPHVVDWSCDGIICYGASNNVVLYKPQVIKKIYIVIYGQLFHFNNVRDITVSEVMITLLIYCAM